MRSPCKLPTMLLSDLAEDLSGADVTTMADDPVAAEAANGKVFGLPLDAVRACSPADTTTSRVEAGGRQRRAL